MWKPYPAAGKRLPGQMAFLRALSDISPSMRNRKHPCPQQSRSMTGDEEGGHEAE
jgi:hypothetical protein